MPTRLTGAAGAAARLEPWSQPDVRRWWLRLRRVPLWPRARPGEPRAELRLRSRLPPLLLPRPRLRLLLLPAAEWPSAAAAAAASSGAPSSLAAAATGGLAGDARPAADTGVAERESDEPAPPSLRHLRSRSRLRPPPGSAAFSPCGAGAPSSPCA